MKRSEMKEHIYNALCGLFMDSDWVEQILSTVEELGMLPPPIEGVYDNIPTVTPTGNLDYGWKRGWEPEYDFDSVQARNEREELRAKPRSMSDDEFDEYMEKQK